MKLVLYTMMASVALGYLIGGNPRHLLARTMRWPGLAVLGLAMQVAPLPGGHQELAVPVLLLSFVPLCVFVVANIRIPGFALLLVGLALNFTVISVNHGMPVSVHALEASGQQQTLHELLTQGGAKHHLMGPDDRLVRLADVIPVQPVRQVVSAGDIVSYAGVAWVIVAGMRPLARRRRVGHLRGALAARATRFPNRETIT